MIVLFGLNKTLHTKRICKSLPLDPKQFNLRQENQATVGVKLTNTFWGKFRKIHNVQLVRLSWLYLWHSNYKIVQSKDCSMFVCLFELILESVEKQALSPDW